MKRLHALLFIGAGMLAGFLGGAVITRGHAWPERMAYDQVVARYGETTVTRGRLAEYAIAKLGANVLYNDLRNIVIVEEHARRAGVTVTADELAGRMKETYDFAESERAKAQLEAVPRWLLEENIRTSMLLEKLAGVTISNNEVATFYAQHPQLFFTPAQADLVCIATSSKNDAQVAWNRLRDGEDPRMLSELYSSDEKLREARGEIGWKTRGVLQADVAEAIFEANQGRGLQPGEFTNVLQVMDKGQRVYFIFFVKEKLDNQTPSLDEARPYVRYLARTMKYDEMVPEWFKSHVASDTWQAIDGDAFFDPLAPLKEKRIMRES